jgi:hypothetical protein
MQEFILTVVVIFVLFRVFGNSRVVFHHHTHQQKNDFQKPPEGKVSIDARNVKPNNHDSQEGEYVDYEEIK